MKMTPVNFAHSFLVNRCPVTWPSKRNGQIIGIIEMFSAIVEARPDHGAQSHLLTLKLLSFSAKVKNTHLDGQAIARYHLSLDQQSTTDALFRLAWRHRYCCY